MCVLLSWRSPRRMAGPRARLPRRRPRSDADMSWPCLRKRSTSSGSWSPPPPLFDRVIALGACPQSVCFAKARERDRERCAAVWIVRGRYLAAVTFDDPLNVGKSDARALHFLTVQSFEDLENLVGIFGFKAGTFIANIECVPGGIVAEYKLDSRKLAATGIPACAGMTGRGQ